MTAPRWPKEDAKLAVVDDHGRFADSRFDWVGVFDTPYGPDLFPWWEWVHPLAEEQSETGQGDIA